MDTGLHTSGSAGRNRARLHRAIVQLVLILTLIIGPGAAGVLAADEISRVVLSKNEVSVAEGDSISLTATAIYVSGATADATIKADWNSSDPAVATVYSGTIAAKAEGTAIVTATYMGKTQVVNVTVVKKVRTLSKDKQSLTLRVGKFEQIALTAAYTDGTSEEVSGLAEWSVDNDTVADVVNGKVTAKSSGETVVTARYGGKTVTVAVAVDVVRRLDPNKDTLDLRIKGTEKVQLIGMFEDGTTQDVADKAEWSSNKEGVADAIKGTITAYGAGQATITARYGGKTASIIVNVETVRKLEADKTDIFIKPGNTASIKLEATYADNNKETVTGQATWTSSDDSVVEVDDGVIVAQAVGQATITAAYGNKTVTITVDSGVARKLEANKSDLQLRRNATENLTLTATYADGSTENVTSKADWFSDNESVAYVSKGTVRTYTKGEAEITAQYGDKTITIPVRVDTAQGLKADVSKLDMRVNDDALIKLTVTYADGTTEDVTQQAEWTTDKAEAATVYQGKVKAIGTGTAVISGKFGDKTVNVTVNVEIAKKLEVDKNDVFLRAGNTEQLKLTASYADGKPIDVTSLATWSSDDEDVADVSASGKITAYKNGQATITASYGSKTVNISVDVSVARKLEVDKKSLSLRKGDSSNVKVTATYANGTTEDVTNAAEWSSDAELVATGKNGTIRALDSGSARITAKYGDKLATIAVDVDPASKLEADQTKFEIQPGDVVKVKLTATYADEVTEDVTGKAEWTTSNSEFAAVEDGVITAKARGEVTVTAKYGKKTVKISVSVGKLDTLTISDKTLVMKEGDRKQLTVLAKYKDGTIDDVTESAEWTTSSATIAEVSEGLVTGIATGKATITAKFGEKLVTSSAQIEVADKLTATYRSLIMQKGQSLQVGVTATYGDGTTEDVTDKATWSISSEKTAEVTDGLVTAIERGKTTLTIKYGTKSISVPVEVDYAVKLTANQKAVDMKSGTESQLTVTATFSDGTTRDVTNDAEWTTRSFKIADVSANGLISAAAYGKTTITAKFGGKSVSIPVEVDTLKYLKSSVKTIELTAGRSTTISLTATYKDGSEGLVNEKAEWKTSRDTTADVKDGTITAYEKGNATITAKFGGKSVSIRVVVK